jgi:hypothetical protein
MEALGVGLDGNSVMFWGLRRLWRGFVVGFVLGFVLVSNCCSHDSGDLSFAPAEALDSLVLQDLPKTRQLQPKSST